MPFLGKNQNVFWNSRFEQLLAPLLVQLSRGVERAGEPLLLSICAHAILLGSERPTLKAYPCHFLFAQYRGIVDPGNAMYGSVVHVVQHLDGGKTVSSRDRFRLTPPTSDAETRPRPKTCAINRLSRHAKLSRCCCCRRRMGFEGRSI